MYWKYNSNILYKIHTNTDSVSFVDIQDNYDKEYMLVATISKAESIESHTLDKAKHLPN